MIRARREAIVTCNDSGGHLVYVYIIISIVMFMFILTL